MCFKETARLELNASLSIMDFHDDLPDARPMLRADAGKNSKLASFGVNLKKPNLGCV